MSKLALLKGATDLSAVARLLAFSPAGLAYLLYKLPAALKYTEFEVAKRYGGSRKISAPSDALKVVQKHLSDLLQDCVQELEEEDKRKNNAAHGFKRHRTIMTETVRNFVFVSHTLGKKENKYGYRERDQGGTAGRVIEGA